MNKSLREKAVNIKGKLYVLVADRVSYFNENYKNGSIVTNLVSLPESPRVVVKATVCPDVDSHRIFTGYSQAVVGEGYINKTSALENAETSAVGRALALMGIGVIDSIASVDEINKASNGSISVVEYDKQGKPKIVTKSPATGQIKPLVTKKPTFDKQKDLHTVDFESLNGPIVDEEGKIT